jgi:hypothetical protein
MQSDTYLKYIVDNLLFFGCLECVKFILNRRYLSVHSYTILSLSGNFIIFRVGKKTLAGFKSLFTCE